jgi:DNA-binding MarR family transcriptional regulator
VGQRFHDLSTFLRTVHPGLTPTQRAIWLAVFAFSENGRATVTQATLARIGGVTVRAVQKALRGLVGRGLLEVLERGKPGRSSVYRYRLG